MRTMPCFRCEDDGEFGYAFTLEKVKRTNQVEMIKVLQDLGYEPEFKANMSGVSSKAEALTLETCVEFGMTDWSHVTFELARDTAMKVLQDVRVTFPDKVATIGKWSLTN